MKNKCAAFNHGVRKNSYSPYGGWYNASTDALVALVPSVLTLFVWWNAGKWPQISEKYEAPKKRPNNGFLLVLYMRSHLRNTRGTKVAFDIEYEKFSHQGVWCGVVGKSVVNLFGTHFWIFLNLFPPVFFNKISGNGHFYSGRHNINHHTITWLFMSPVIIVFYLYLSTYCDIIGGVWYVW